ncbi:MAG TPA: polyribonucleotide nucleotidyltransferase [Bacillota bacterium]|nr:polyribonucleotide nucleotidyltransferase [Bacillota bacterium]HOH10327.1 polyribonucleotide nucleotidyltransferase [Bacillota bacterium]HOS49855.1 polyribonucleotide nucleotidyltransferase [Bacillota bacterium]HPI01917.1 polyribonucleotide nucleotidyltransferase [Bacillota bacterium]HPM63858.1 polyribonucleotide nucleotidyltransferase [Bacillota bacterium]
MHQVFTMDIGGKVFTAETGKFAKQASGSVLCRYGETVVLVTATMAKQAREGIDFFPLLVDYEERMYAAGKIPGGFIKREGRPSEAAILAGRMIDRPIRPLFPDGFRNDVQIVATVLSVEPGVEPSLVALNGASIALSISPTPFQGPIGGVKVGRVDGKFVINPGIEEQNASDMSVVVAGTRDAILMVEAGANEVSEADMLDAILYGHEQIKRIIEFQDGIVAAAGTAKIEFKNFEPAAERTAKVKAYGEKMLVDAVKNPDKLSRDAKIEEAKAAIKEHFVEEFAEEASTEEIAYMVDSLEKSVVRMMITKEHIRPDGRALDEIRPLYCEVGLLPRVHGSGLFQRGQTQVLTSCTLGSASEEQVLDGLGHEESKNYMHQYNFPPYSVGEVKPIRGPGRREVGHGALAERALVPVIPSQDKFPYTIRMVSEAIESNGSTSQASICGSTLALMDAGVPIRKPVAGIAMGLVKYGEDFTILTDIQGIEDHLGDMDFKVAGTADGITAIQMDIKVDGLSKDILEKALAQAKKGRLFILDTMRACISEPKAELSPYAPRIISFTIDVDKIREVIGPGGKMIRKIVEMTGASIDIEDDGRVFISSVGQEGGIKAENYIKALVSDPEVGAVYTGKVTRIMTFGAFVEILPGKEGLVHISQLAAERVAKVEDVVKVGDEITVKLVEIDSQGRLNLSRKELLPKPEHPAAEDAAPRRDRPERFHGHGGGDDLDGKVTSRPKRRD